MRARGHDPASRDQASGLTGSRQSGGDAQERARAAALPQSGSDRRDCQAVDRQVRARGLAGAFGSQEESGKVRSVSEKFVYVTYIRTTPEKLWDALTKPEFTRAYWCETWQDCDWKAGSPWRIMIPDGRVADSGEVLELDRPRRLVLSWRNEFTEMKAEGYSRATFELEPAAGSVKLTVTHEIEQEGSKFIASVSK